VQLSNSDAEAIVLAGILSNPDAYWTINTVGLTAKDFNTGQSRRVMAAIEAVAGDRKKPERVLVIEELAEETKVLDYVEALNRVPSGVGQAIEAARVVKGLSTSRQLVTVGAGIIALAEEHRADSETAVAEAETLLRGVRTTLPQPERSPNPADILVRIREMKDLRSTRIRFSPTLDGMTNGLQPGHLWVVGGFSSTGKSAVAVNFVYDALRANRTVGVWSLEMTQEQYLIRLLSCATGIPQSTIRSRAFIGHDTVDLMKRVESWVARAPLAIYDTHYRLQDIRRTAIAQKETMGLDLMIVDFIQNVYDKGEEFGDARATILELQNLAKELDCTVMALSQVSNDYAKNADTNKNYYSFKGHGAIRDAADIAVMLKRDRVNTPGIMDFDVVKHRHGEFGVIPMNFDLQTGRLTDATDLMPESEDND
jgi:replicative DNA helicase